MVSMNEMKTDNGYTDISVMAKDCILKIHDRVVKDEMSGVPSGFQQLDNITDGFEKGKVYIIGGRPCMGKEELILSMIINIITEDVPVLLFSTNHKMSDYVQRLLSIHCDIRTLCMHNGQMDAYEWERLDKNMDSIMYAPLFIHDSLDLPLNELIDTVHNCIKEKAIKIIFIDCLQMIDFDKGSESVHEKVAKVMYSLKQLACQADIPIVVGSMLGRGVEIRENLEGKQPFLSDLANSSYIEEIADVILMVHRPECYCIYKDETGREFYGVMELIVKKNSLKPVDCIYLKYQQNTGILYQDENGNIDTSKLVSLKELGADNKTINKLMNALDLEELPF
jgi:replicative DNA helicase